MREYQHKLAGIFPGPAAMEQTEQLFRDQGFLAGQISPIRAEESLEQQQFKIESESGAIRDEFIKDISIGTGVGGVAGVAGAIHGLHIREDVLTSVVEDALKEGYPVLMIEARDKEEVEKAHQLMQSTMRIEEARY